MPDPAWLVATRAADPGRDPAADLRPATPSIDRDRPVRVAACHATAEGPALRGRQPGNGAPGAMGRTAAHLAVTRRRPAATAVPRRAGAKLFVPGGSGVTARDPAETGGDGGVREAIRRHPARCGG